MSQRNALVTGYPGSISRRLVKKLLTADDELKVSLLVEASREAQAQAEVDKLSEQITNDLNLPERVRIFAGDVTSMDVGLSGPEFRALTTEVTEVYHLAAAHSLSVERRIADQVNVQGTANVLALARAMQRLERFVHFSSAYVSGNRQGVIMEDELEEGQGFRSAYEATKYQAEVLVRRAAERLPVTIVRPAGVLGDSRTGETDRYDSVYAMLALLVASPVAIPLPLPGDGHAPLNLVPVDFVVDAIHVLVNRPETIGKTFHVVDPNPLSARRVYEAIAKKSGKTPPKYKVPPNLTKALLRIPALERFAPVSHQALDYLNHMAFYNSRNLFEALQGTGLSCPTFESYVEQLMSYAKNEFER